MSIEDTASALEKNNRVQIFMLQWFVPAVIVVFYFLLLMRSRWLWFVLSVLMVLPVIAIVWFLRTAGRNGFFRFAMPLIIFLSAGFLQMYILDNSIYRIILVLFSGSVTFLFFRAMLAYVYFPEKYPAATLSGLITWMILFSVFFGSSGAFALRVFLHPPLLIELAIVAVSSLISFWILGVWHSLSGRSLVWYVVLMIGLGLELQSILFFWPSSYYVGGYLVLSFVYLMHLGILRALGKNIMNATIYMRYFFGILALDAIILLSARWI